MKQKLMLIFMGAVIFLTLAVSVIAAAEEAGLAQRIGARRILSERSRLISSESHGKYYLVKPGRYFYERQFVPVDGEKKPLLSSRWKAREKSTPRIERPAIGIRHTRMAGRYLNIPKEQQKVKQHRYARRTLGTGRVDIPANPRGRYYVTPSRRYGRFTDKLTNQVVK